MELKQYQQAVIADLQSFLDKLNEKENLADGYAAHWESKGIVPKYTGKIKPYQTLIAGVPSVCIKVPTGGGKTLLACQSVSNIFQSIGTQPSKLVIWLVPSETIFAQTYANLSDPDHPYRQKLNQLFQGRVQILNKEQLISGAGLDPESVKINLTVCVLIYASLRAKNKEDRKLYQQNGQLYGFNSTIDDGLDLSVMEVIKSLRPVVVVDEAHNTVSALSVDMFKSLAPRFILELTATPKDKSNIISFTNAEALKLENMVKLPVFVKNHTDKADLLVNAIGLQQQLERRAKVSEKAKEAPYLRPIVLLQAQTKAKENDATFQQIKKNLIELGIPENQIAIKTAEIDELKKWPNLQSKACPIRYIITINALKEGWDAPFAYILASMANRSSSVEVEQILGRVLRLPGAKRHPQDALNCSYVFTASASFSSTLQNIVEGLNQAGFSENDYRLAETKPTLAFPVPKPVHFPTPEAEEQAVSEKIAKYAEVLKNLANEDSSDSTPNTDASNSLDSLPLFSEVSQILETATTQESELFSKVQKQAAAGIAPLSEEERKMKKTYQIKDVYADAVTEISLPHFFYTDSEVTLGGIFELENLKERILNTVDLLGGGGDDTKKFKLSRADANIDFESAKLEMVRVDIERTSNNDYTPVYKEFSKKEALAFQNYINEAAPDRQNKLIAMQLTHALNQLNVPSSNDVKTYVLRVVESLAPAQLEFVKLNPEIASKAIKEKIENLKLEHMEKAFFQMIETGKISVKSSFRFQHKLALTSLAEPLPMYSLYEKEGSINGLEREFIDKISSLPNVLCWHRNLVGPGFHINGCYLNHYPDFIIITKRKNVFVVETKGDHLKNDETIRKIKIGNKWAELAGTQFKYFMVFKNRPLEGSKSIADVIEIIENR